MSREKRKAKKEAEKRLSTRQFIGAKEITDYCSFIPPLKKLLTHKKIRTGIPDKIQNAGIFKADRQKSIYPCQNTREHKSRLRSC